MELLKYLLCLALPMVNLITTDHAIQIIALSAITAALVSSLAALAVTELRYRHNAKRSNAVLNNWLDRDPWGDDQ